MWPRLASPRLRGEGHTARRKFQIRLGEGALPQVETRGGAPSSPTFSPHAGRRSEGPASLKAVLSLDCGVWVPAFAGTTHKGPNQTIRHCAEPPLKLAECS